MPYLADQFVLPGDLISLKSVLSFPVNLSNFMSLHPFMISYCIRNLFAVSWHACMSEQSVVGRCSN